MSRLRADTLINYSGSGTPNFKSGVTGATVTFTGDVTAANGSFTGNVTIDGNLTYKDVTNVDSVGIITAQQGIQVSANGVTVSGVGTFNNPITVAGIATINGGGLDVTGVITATSYSGDGSSLSGVSPSVSGIASGTLANGQTVIIHSDGKVGGITTSSITQANGSAVVFNSADTGGQTSTIFDSNAGRIVVAYRDGGLGGHGVACVGTVDPSDNSISFGTEVAFASHQIDYVSAAFDSSNNKVVIVYSDISGSNNYVGKAIVGTVDSSDNSISFGSAVTYASAATAMPSVTFDSSNNKIVIAFRDNGNSYYGTAIVGTVSGTSISFGSEVVFESANVTYNAAVFDSTNNKVVIAYRDNGNSSYGTAVVGTVSGTSISFGSAVVFESASTYDIGLAFDSSNDKIIIAYGDNGNNAYGTAIVGTVSGTSISFAHQQYMKVLSRDQNSIAYDSNANKVVVSYKDDGDSAKGKYVVGTVSGTSISFNSATVFLAIKLPLLISSRFDSSNNKVVTSYKDHGNSNYGTSVVIQPGFESTTLSSSNFLGFSNAAYTDGQTATIQIAGAVDDAQSGLTTASVHYVQNDGTLSTSAGSPSVEAGLALSATEIVY